MLTAKLERRTTLTQLDALLVDTAGVGHLCGLSSRTIRRMDSAAMLPRALSCGSSKRWRIQEIRDWVASGCPDRKTWESMQKP